MTKVIMYALLLFLPVLPVSAQDGKKPDSKPDRDFPGLQLMRPSLPPWRYNLETHRWERDRNSSDILLTEEIPSRGGVDMNLMRRSTEFRSTAMLATHRRHGRSSLRKRSHHSIR